MGLMDAEIAQTVIEQDTGLWHVFTDDGWVQAPSAGEIWLTDGGDAIQVLTVGYLSEIWFEGGPMVTYVSLAGDLLDRQRLQFCALYCFRDHFERRPLTP